MTHPWLKYKTKTAKDYIGAKFKLDVSREPSIHTNRVSIPIVLLKNDGKLEKNTVEISDIAFSILMRNIDDKTDEEGSVIDQIFTFERDQKDRVIIMEVK